jgi:hypothetical protein
MMKLGVRVTKVHRVLKFRQEAWLKPYMDFLTEKRASASNPFEDNFYKIMGNSYYGKTMENTRKHMDIKMFRADDPKCVKYQSKPNYSAYFTDVISKDRENDLKLLKMEKTQVWLDKPIAVGIAILELSKLHMYELHYDYMIPKFGVPNMKLLMNDTDSLCYHIKCEDVYKSLFEMREIMDLSTLPPIHASLCYDITNRKVGGMLKDVTEGVPIVEFQGMQSKVYAFRTEYGDEKKTIKAVVKYTKDGITLQDYKNTIATREPLSREQTTIRSKNHQIETVVTTRVTMTASNNKRYLLDDGITSLPYGHKSIRP